MNILLSLFQVKFQTVDVLVISATINLCTILIFFLLKCLSFWRNIETLTGDNLTLTRKTFRLSLRITEQILIWVGIILAIWCLSETDVLKYPLYFPKSEPISSVLKMTYNFTIGKYFFLSFVRVFCMRDKYPAILIHYFVTLSTYIIMDGFEQNMLAGLLGPFMETTSSPVVFLKIANAYTLSKSTEKSTLIAYFMEFVATILIRTILPIASLIYIYNKQDIFAMDNIPLSFFFLSIVFFGIINFWFIFKMIANLYQLIHNRKGNKLQVLSDDKNSFYHNIISYLQAKYFIEKEKSHTTGNGEPRILKNNLNSTASKESETHNKSIKFLNNFSTSSNANKWKNSELLHGDRNVWHLSLYNEKQFNKESA
ncbi:uncharacterized protein LOC115215870 [Argonauta hians]